MLRQKQHALIALQKYGAGNVLLLSFDRTWRLRYRVGDPHHHRFWGQVLRWATTDKLSGGTTHARLGTDRLRYQAGERVAVRAQLLDENSDPVESDDVEAHVFLGDELMHRQHLNFAPTRGDVSSGTRRPAGRARIASSCEAGR